MYATARPALQLMQWQAATQCSGLTSRHTGSSWPHASVAYGQRLLKRQPEGGFTGEGTSPSRTIRSRSSSTSGSGTGTAESRAWVYGCKGLLYSSSLGAISTITPRYITPTRSEMYLTTERSWEMNRYVRSRSLWSLFIRLMTWAWIE